MSRADATRPARLRAALAGLALVVVVGVVVVVAVRASPGRPAAPRAALTGGATVVKRRNLVSTDTESGTLSYANPHTVYNRLRGTVTWLPRVGHAVAPGGVLFRVDDQPVVLLDGSVPAYRTLDAGAERGPDVLELNRNLKRLGFDAGAIRADDVWQPATTLGVEKLQASLGEDETGGLTLGRVVFEPGRQLVSSLGTTVGSRGAGAVLQTTSTRLVVTVALDPNSQSEAEVGGPVTVELPSGNTVAGTITAVSAVAQRSRGSASTVPVTVALSGHPPGRGLDQAAVSVNFVAERARGVLSVPVTALVATAGASYALQQARPPHALIPVTPGLFAAGYVQVSGPRVRPGLTVTDSQG